MIDEYLAGTKLYGDDFDTRRIRRWYEEETEAYATLVQSRNEFLYVYHALDAFHGYRHATLHYPVRALGLGSALGDEFLPITEVLTDVVILEPSDWLTRHSKLGAATYLRPTVTGQIELPSDTYDLVTCLGVLHHIPNVSFVLGELQRCLRPGGFMLLREPIVSQGDWRKPRAGLTRNERGIPLPLLDRMIESSGLKTVSRHLWAFSPLKRLATVVGSPTYNSGFYVWCDYLISKLFWFNSRYHRVRIWHNSGRRQRIMCSRSPEPMADVVWSFRESQQRARVDGGIDRWKCRRSNHEADIRWRTDRSTVRIAERKSGCERYVIESARASRNGPTASSANRLPKVPSSASRRIAKWPTANRGTAMTRGVRKTERICPGLGAARTRCKPKLRRVR